MTLAMAGEATLVGVPGASGDVGRDSGKGTSEGGVDAGSAGAGSVEGCVAGVEDGGISEEGAGAGVDAARADVRLVAPS